MLLNKVFINNYKSFLDFEISNLEPFTVFFGTNASGKSNLFEAIELFQLSLILGNDAIDLFGNFNDIYYYYSNQEASYIKIVLENELSNVELQIKRDENFKLNKKYKKGIADISFLNNISRIYLNHPSKLPLKSDEKLSSNGDNLDLVLRRILENQEIQSEFIEAMTLLVPEFENIEVKKDEVTGNLGVVVYEKSGSKPFTKNLISDGTRNLLIILTSLYQTDKPQFLLFEEPEIGLNPKVIQELVQLFRERCEATGSNIWINTHSQTLVSEITTKEAILVEKKDGITKAKPLRDFTIYDLKVDQAWLSNVFDGGLPW